MEMDQSETAEVTPNENNWRIMYSQTHTDQDNAIKPKNERYTFQTPYVCRSGDSGFHSDITPDSVESVHNFTHPSQPSGSHNKIVQDDLLNFQPFLGVNSTPNPGNCIEMMETSMYAEDEQIKVMKQLMLNRIDDDFTMNDVDESNVMISKEEKSTNISSLYTNLNSLSSDNNYYNSSRVEEISSESFHKYSDRHTLGSNVVQMEKTSALKKCVTLFNTKPLVIHSPEKRASVSIFVEESTNQVKEKNNSNFSHTSLEYVLQTINSLPPLVSPTKQNLRSTTESKLSKRRYLNGIERLDILYFLGMKGNFLNIVSKIFGYLSPCDLMNVRNVSFRWSKIVDMAPTKKILKEFKKQQKEQKENVPKSQESSCDLKHKRTPGRQTYLNAIQNTSFLQPQRTSGSPQLSPAVSPSKIRFHLYQKEGQKLKQGERLLRCPKCMFPSHDPGSTYATCTRVGCKYEFCIFCRNEYSANHHCPPFYTPRLCKRTITIGSKGSKRNLRRL